MASPKFPTNPLHYVSHHRPPDKIFPDSNSDLSQVEDINIDPVSDFSPANSQVKLPSISDLSNRKVRPDIDDDGFILVSRRKSKIPQSHWRQAVSNVSTQGFATSGAVNGRQMSVQDKAGIGTINGCQLSMQDKAGTGDNSVVKTKSSRLWRDVISESSISTQFPLSFIPPENFNGLLCAYSSEDLTKKAREKWANSIVLYVLGCRPYFQFLKDYIIRIWQPVHEFQIYSRDNGFYLIKFDSADDCEKILNNGPYFFFKKKTLLNNGPYFYNKKLVMIKKWSPGVKLNKEFLRSIPVWVRLPSLDLDFWTEDTISRIISVIGKPIKLDQITKGMLRISFARALVEVDIDCKFPQKIPILTSDKQLNWQPITYEWIPTACTKCRCFGHSDILCQVPKVWVQKFTSNINSSMDIDSTKQSSQHINDSDMAIDANISCKNLPNSSNTTNLEAYMLDYSSGITNISGQALSNPPNNVIDSLQMDNDKSSMNSTCTVLENGNNTQNCLVTGKHSSQTSKSYLQSDNPSSEDASPGFSNLTDDDNKEQMQDDKADSFEDSLMNNKPLHVFIIFLFIDLEQPKQEIPCYSTTSSKATSINSITLSASLLAAISSINQTNELLNVSSAVLFSSATIMMLLINKLQPSQLSEEQTKATQLFKQLENSILTTIAIGTPTEQDVEEFVQKVLAIDKAYPLPLLPLLEKFPKKVEGARWWPLVERRSNGNNRWSEEVEEVMRGVLRVMKAKDRVQYQECAELAVKINKILAVTGPLMAAVAAVGALQISNGSFWAVLFATVGGALATVVNTLEHGGQIGMIFELFRNNVGYFKNLEEEIENGELFLMKMALSLGRSVPELKSLAAYASDSTLSKEIEEFASKLF